ncbi:glycerol kinase [Lasius niger]|uniref:Glycerol kinase n=1 Tax=Lasius niger TaxID=67767 RepID=A0A0J7JWP3_LASNI|nr:glycerol kinase [Lasius niger]
MGRKDPSPDLSPQDTIGDGAKRSGPKNRSQRRILSNFISTLISSIPRVTRNPDQLDGVMSRQRVKKIGALLYQMRPLLQASYCMNSCLGVGKNENLLTSDPRPGQFLC